MALQRVRRITDFGEYREVENYLVAPMLGNHSPRGKRKKKTQEAVEKNNDRAAVRKCENKLKYNFSPGDWWATLTYDDLHHPQDMERAKKNIRNFLCKAKRLCNKKGKVLKYGQVTELGTKTKRWHHHIIIPGYITYEELEKLWPNGNIHVKRLWRNSIDDEKDSLNVLRLAEYIVGTSSEKRQEMRENGLRQYSFSRNCLDPVVTYEFMSPRWIARPRDTDTWKLDPKSLVEYTDAYGLKHQRYIQIRKKE